MHMRELFGCNAGAQVVANKTLTHANCIAGREIVAGQKGRAGFEDGLPDVSQLNKPSAIFLSHDAKCVIICDDGNAAVFFKVVHARVYICLYRCIHIDVYVNVYIYIYIYMYIYIHIYVYIYVCIHIYVYICIYVYSMLVYI